MCVPAMYALGVKFHELLTVIQEVDDLRRRGVATLDDHHRRSQLVNAPRGLTAIVVASNGYAGERLGFRNVRRHHERAAQQLGFHGANCLVVNEAIAAFGNHYRVDDEQWNLEILDGCRDGFDDGGIGQHACLGRVYAEVRDNGFDLRGDQVSREGLESADTLCILRGDGRDRAGAVDSVRRKCLQVGLDAGASARIASCNCQCYTHTVQFRAMTLVDTLASRNESRQLIVAIRIASVVFIAGLTAAAAQISIPLPFTAVPFTFQPIVVLIGGLALGPRLGLASQMIYLAAGIAGWPVFAASATLPPGAARLLGPTGGYLMAYPFAACVTGYLAARAFDRSYWRSAVAMLAGLAVVYVGGLLWLALLVGAPAAIATGFYPFILPDLVKVAAAAGVMPSVWYLLGYRPNTSRY
jgi:biotin transport system substrate-specific component